MPTKVGVYNEGQYCDRYQFSRNFRMQSYRQEFLTELFRNVSDLSDEENVPLNPDPSPIFDVR